MLDDPLRYFLVHLFWSSISSYIANKVQLYLNLDCFHTKVSVKPCKYQKLSADNDAGKPELHYLVRSYLVDLSDTPEQKVRALESRSQLYSGTNQYRYLPFSLIYRSFYS